MHNLQNFTKYTHIVHNMEEFVIVICETHRQPYKEVYIGIQLTQGLIAEAYFLNLYHDQA